MATVVPPRYVSLTTRSEEDQNAAAFEHAMTQYAAGRYARASEELGAIAARAPDLVHVQFFLGISQLLAGDTVKAKEALNASVAAGAPPYSDEAHFYLAKAALKEKDLAAARRELRQAIAREAGPNGEARRLLAELDKTVSR
jgi:predicted Zn-dependent protease